MSKADRRRVSSYHDRRSQKLHPIPNRGSQHDTSLPSQVPHELADPFNDSLEDDEHFYNLPKKKYGDKVKRSAIASGTENLDQVLKKSGHTKIKAMLQNFQLGQLCECGDPKERRKHSVLATVMQHATNWDRLVLRQLDECVSAAESAEDENDPEYYVKVDFRPLFGHKSSMIKEILEKGHKKAQLVLTHPVLEVYLELQSKKMRWFFRVSFFLYLMFIFCYTGHQIMVFYFRDKHEQEISTFPNCFWNSHGWECTFGFLQLIAVSLLLFEEIFLIYTFRLRYYKRFDVYVKQGVYLSSLIGYGLQTDLFALKILSGLSVPAGWLYLILLSGFHGTTISIMFIHIMHKRFLGGLLLTMNIALGFGSGFLIASYSQDRNLDYVMMIKTLFRPLLMILGEFEFNDLFDNYKENTSLFYASALLLSIAVMGSLVLVNLILALILSDVSHLYSLCHSKEIFRQAIQVTFFERVAKMVFGRFQFAQRVVKLPPEVYICLHESCHCPHLQLTDVIHAKLKKVVAEKNPEDFERPSDALSTVTCVIDEIL